MESKDAIPEIHLDDPQVLRDPFGAYGRAREQSAVGRIVAPGMSMWVALRHREARTMLASADYVLRPASFMMRPQVPESYLPYMRTMQEMEGAEHARLRRLVAPAFSRRRVAAMARRMADLVDRLIDDLAGRSGGGAVDLLEHFARRLPSEAISDLVGVPDADRAEWARYGAAVAAGHGREFAEAIPSIIDDAQAIVARRRDSPGNDLVSDLLGVQAEDGDRLSDAEIVTLVWHLMLAGQVPTNSIANAVEALLGHPEELARLRADPGLMPRAVEELLRFAPPQLLTIPRFTTEAVELGGVPIPEGEPVTASVAAANRDPRVFDDPDRLDLGRRTEPAGHLSFAHGPHFCLGAPLARLEMEVALGRLIYRFPDLRAAPGEPPARMPDPGAWRLVSLPVLLRAA